MPSDLMFAESSFPNIAAEQSQEEKTRVIMNYLYMLLEQLRYSFRNIGQENFNPQEFETISEVIREPVTIQVTQVGERVDTAEEHIATVSDTVDGYSSRITDAENNASQAVQTANGLATRVTSAEGNISTLQQTATALTSRVSAAEGDVSTLRQTATSLTSRVSTAEGNVSTLQQTATSLTSRISTAEGNVSSLQQTATGLRTDVNNAAGAASTAQQTAESITLTVTGNSAGTSSTIKLMRGQTQVTSQTISFSGLVKFTDLSTAGQTTIVGDNITSGTIKGVTLLSEGTLNRFVQIWDGTAMFGEVLDGTVLRGIGSVEADVANHYFKVGGNDMRLEGNGDVYLDSSANGNIYIGAMSLTQEDIYIGRLACNTYLRGNIYVNGNLIS